jgi:predicted Zn-dependent protease
MKKIIQILLAIVILICINKVKAQNTTNSVSVLENDLKETVRKISQLDSKLKNSLYSDFSLSSEYNRFYESVLDLTKKLAQIEKGFENFSKNNKSEKDYYLKIAYTNLAAVSIYNKRKEYLISLLLKDESVYNSTLSEWEKLEYQQISSAHTNLDKAKKLEASNIDIRIIDALLMFYEKNYDNSIKELKKLLKEIENKKKEIVTNENIDFDAYAGFIHSWLAYIYITNNDLASAKEELENTVISRNPIENTSWALATQKKLEEIKIKNTDTKIRPVELVKEVTRKVPKLEKTFDAKGKIVIGLKLTEEDRSTINSPKNLIEKTSIAWNDLINLETKPWEMANAQLNEKNKQMYDNPTQMYVEMNIKNKGAGPININMHLDRFIEMFNLFGNFILYKESWNQLVKNNPDIPFYRSHRLKCNLAVSYYNKNKDEYLNVFNYTPNFDKKRIQYDEFSEYLNKNPKQEIDDDLNYLITNCPNDPLTLLAKAETAILLNEPSQAMGVINDVSSQIPQNARIDDNDLQGYLLVLKAFLYFKMKNYDEAKNVAQKLSDYSYASEWQKNLEMRIKFAKKEEELIKKYGTK